MMRLWSEFGGSDMAISDTIKKGIIRAPHRSLLRATGVVRDNSDWGKPFIAVCNSFVQIIPGHAHLDVVGRKVRDAVRAAGGVPFEFNTIGVVCIPNCDKIVPGMMMAAARVNIPAIFVSGGPMKAGVSSSGKAIDLATV